MGNNVLDFWFLLLKADFDFSEIFKHASSNTPRIPVMTEIKHNNTAVNSCHIIITNCVEFASL